MHYTPTPVKFYKAARAWVKAKNGVANRDRKVKRWLNRQYQAEHQLTIVRTNNNVSAGDMSKKQQTDETAITASQSIKFHKCQLLAFSSVAALYPGSFSLSQCVGKA